MKNRAIILTSCALLAIAGRAQSASSVVINEICAANVDQWVDPSFNYGGWMEVYNPTSQTISLKGWYVSDDPEHLKMARINATTNVAPGSYATLWFDHYDWKLTNTADKMLDMKLDTDGGTLYLSNTQGTIVAQADYPEAVSRCSWARTQNGGEEWKYCSTPTPGKSNVNAKFAMERLEAPVVEETSQFFASGSATLHVNIPEGCTLYYTTDGSTPVQGKASISSNGVMTASYNRLYRFRLFKDGYLPSPVVTRTCIRESYAIDLPILSIVGTTNNFYSDSLGIFTQGRNGRPGNGYNTKCNWNMDWERPADFQYFTPEGELLFEQEVGLERCGGWSRAWTPYSFKIKAGKQYEGKNTLDYDFFSEKPRLKHKALQIRNGGNDNNCRMKDACLTQIIAASGINIDYQAYQPIAHFVNGTWKGAINMREPNNKHFVLANYGLDDDMIDQFEMSPDSGYVQKCGTKDRWKQLLTLSRSSYNQTSYNQICEMLDIDEYCNYMAIELFLQNWDWPQNNVKAWTPREEGGRFRFVVFDMDGSFSNSDPFNYFASKQTYTFDVLYDQNGRRLTQEIEMVTLFLNLLNNTTFRKKFIDTYCIIAYSVFDPAICRETINRLANRVAPTQALYKNESPWGTANDLINKLSASYQSQMMNTMKNYSKMLLTGKTAQSVDLKTDLPEARLMINDIEVPRNTFKGNLFSPIVVKASAPEGYTFTGWKKTTTSTTTVMPSTVIWKYYDQGSLNNQNWNSPTFNDGAWKSGKAPLGFDTGNAMTFNTRLSYGTDANNKRPTYYFRTTIELDKAPTASDIYRLNYTADDGFIIYVNGQEAARYNMPSGNVYYSTYATTYANNNPDSGTLDLSSSLFKEGSNVIAVELHNHSATSSDVYWSANLQKVGSTGSTIVSTSPEYTLPNSGSVQVIACFERNAQVLSHPVVINEVCADNGIQLSDYRKKGDWIELYNTTSEDIDLSGMMLTDNLKKADKWIISAEDSEASTIIPAHGYKLIWCDKNPCMKELHAPFKLDNEDGKQVMLSAADGSWHDTLTYNFHLSTETVGRHPDGGRNVYLMTRPSIEKSNVMTSYCMNVEQPASTQAIERIYDDSIWSDPYEVYDLSGRLITSGEGSLEERLARGVYVVKNKAGVFKVMVP